MKPAIIGCPVCGESFLVGEGAASARLVEVPSFTRAEVLAYGKRVKDACETQCDAKCDENCENNIHVFVDVAALLDGEGT